MLACTARRFLASAIFGSSFSFTVSAAAADTWADPFPGVRHLHRETSNQNINVLRVDLCASGIDFRATKSTERGKTVSSFGAAVGAQAAVNGDFYIADHWLERGIAVGDGAAWPASKIPEDESVGQLAFGDGRIELVADAVLQKVEPWMKNVVGGRPTLLVDGQIGDFSGHPNLCLKNPRTAVGLGEGKKLLYVAVVDGRAEKRVGMTCTELAEFMRELGAGDAMAFDGGGSSTMWIDGQGVLNYPTDGKERVVSNHLAIFARGEGRATACERPPAAKLDVVCDAGIRGWVKDAPEPVDLDMTFDALPGAAGAKVLTVSAQTKRSDTCNDAGACGLGFEAALPRELVDGVAHEVKVSFRGRPRDVVASTTFTCHPPSSEPIDASAPEGEGEGRARPTTTDSDGCRAAPRDRSGGPAVPAAFVAAAAALVVQRLRRRGSGQ